MKNYKKISGRLKQLSVSINGEVWGVNSINSIYRYNQKENKWNRVPGKLKQISIGSKDYIIGVNVDDKIFHWKNNAWRQISGSLKYVSTSADDETWGINADNEVYRRDWKKSKWERMPGHMVQVSVGSQRHIWGINADGNIFRWKNNTWEQVPGKLKQISVGADGTVWGVNKHNYIYRRIYSKNKWVRQAGKLAHISVGTRGDIWGVDANDNIFQKLYHVMFINNPANDDSYSITLQHNGNEVDLDVGEEVRLTRLTAGEKINILPKLDPNLPEEDRATYKAWPEKYTVHKASYEQIIDAGRIFHASRVGSVGYKRVANADANRFSFDLLSMNPFYLDYDKAPASEGKDENSGGKMKQIFERLDDNDVDWEPLDGGVVLKRQFEYSTMNSGGGSASFIVTNSAKQFTKQLSIGIKTSGEVEGLGGVNNSAGFNYSKLEGQEENTIYAYAADRIRSYKISLNQDEVKLTNSFIKAIENISNSEDARDFIHNWGTHFADWVIYGGMRFAIHTFHESKLLEASKKGFNIGQSIKASVEGLSVGRSGELSYSEGDEYRSSFGKGEAYYEFIGGAGYRNEWSVSAGNAQPIEIKLNRLSNLLNQSHFQRMNSLLNKAQLAKRKKWLNDAIDTHLKGQDVEGDEVPKPKFFTITVDNWTMVKTNDGDKRDEVFGRVKISDLCHTNSEPADLGYDVAWDGHQKREQAVSKKAGEEERINYLKSYSINQSKQQNNVFIYGEFQERDRNNPDDYIGNMTKTIKLSELDLKIGQSVKDSFRIDWGNSTIEVHYTIMSLPHGLTDFS